MRQLMSTQLNETMSEPFQTNINSHKTEDTSPT